MARTGLRMMPTFPLPPLKFRTAGFPQYGFKAGFSDAAFPADWFAIVLRALRCHRVSPALCQGRCACKHLRASGPPRSTPGALAPVRVILSRSIITYSAPSAPLAGTSRLHRLAAYTRCLRCAYLRMPRRPTTGSELSLMVFRNMSSSVTTGNFSAAYTQYFTENAGLQLQLTVSAFPLSSHSDSSEGDCFRGLTTVRLRYDLLLCLPSLSEQTGFAPSPRGRLLPGFRWFGHPPHRRISLQRQLGNLRWRDFHPQDHQLASLH
jgi:hypothetical protein